MIKQWLSWLNLSIIFLSLFFIVFGIYYWANRPDQITLIEPKTKKSGLPKGGFELEPEVYQKIGGPLLGLQEIPPSLQVPDLRQQLIYYGKNGRPDAKEETITYHFSFNSNNKVTASVRANEKLYLTYDRHSSPPRYTFSPNNEKTSLWITPTPSGSDVDVTVTLENEKGELISQPDQYAHFRLPEKDFSRYVGSNWEIGGQRVDGTILARQKARWFGLDRFLEQHGGEEYQFMHGKNRIDMGENNDIHSVFVDLGDSLVWDNGSWKTVGPGVESLGKPLLVVKKIDDRLMSFELWDVDGKGKITLNLLKSTEPWGTQNTQMLQTTFKFVGARTLKQSVFEVNRERMVLNPFDWLLLTPKGWKKLDTEQEIEDYVKRKSTGTLFVYDGIERKEDKQFMKGTLYNSARSEFQDVEIPLQTSSTKPGKEKEKKEPSKSGKEQEAKEVVDFLEEMLAPLTRAEGEVKGQKPTQKATGKPSPKPQAENKKQINSKVMKK